MPIHPIFFKESTRKSVFYVFIGSLARSVGELWPESPENHFSAFRGPWKVFGRIQIDSSRYGLPISKSIPVVIILVNEAQADISEICPKFHETSGSARDAQA